MRLLFDSLLKTVGQGSFKIVQDQGSRKILGVNGQGSGGLGLGGLEN